MKPYQILQKILPVPMVLIAQHLIAQGNLVVNSGFDADAAGWTLLNGSAYAGPLKGNPGGWVDLDSLSPSLSDPTITQLINGLILGQTYMVSGDFEKTINRSGGTISDLSFGVAMDGVFLYETSDPGDFNWHSFSFSYTATSSSAVLSLSSQLNGTEISYGIDNISMYLVPEPSVMSLLAFASGAFAYVYQWRRRF
ncbi:MAG: hypothetical protein WDM76_15815 [Limisphaerales bacterium]